MNYCESLEGILEAKEVIDKIESALDSSQYSIENTDTDLITLQKIRLFLSKERETRMNITKSSMLDSTDCLTVASIINLVAYRKGVETRIVRPDKKSRYFHAMLTYNHHDEIRIFKPTGSSRIYPPVDLKPEDVKKRLGYVRPIINTINRIRGF